MLSPDKSPAIGRLVIAACGSIHAALLPAYIQVLQRKLVGSIRVAMTHTAAEIVSADTLQQYSSHDVYTRSWPNSPEQPPAHIMLASWAERILVLPATANMIGKAANGIADDVVSTLLISYDGPIIFAPAMNATMWLSKTVQRNVKVLQSDGHVFIPSIPCAPVARGTEEGDGISPSIRTVVNFLAAFSSQDSMDKPIPAKATKEKAEKSVS